MKLTDLLSKVDYECVQGNVDREIGKVVYDSRKIEEGCLFICIPGANFDGHDFAAQAAKDGAAALVVSREMPEIADKNVTVIRVKDTRYAMAFISAAYFGYPAEKLRVIGVTGTKGCLLYTSDAADER